MSKFSSRLKQLRQEKDFTLDELANALKVSKSTLSKYETDQREPKLYFAMKLAEYFDVYLDWLMGRSDDRNGHKKVVVDTMDSDIQYIKIAMDAKASGISPEKLKALVEFLKQS